MAFDLESLGGGAATGIFGSILVGLGFHRRLNRVEDGKQDKSVCGPLHDTLWQEMINLRGDIKHLTDRIDLLIHTRRE